MQEQKNKVETILFTTGRFIGLEELARMCEIGSLGVLKQILERLKQDYTQRNGALELIEQGSKWKLNIRREYLYLTEKLLTDSEMDRPTQETLAVIAFKSPIFQSDVVKIRGNTAYDHVKTLRELEFITSEKSGRTRLLKITPKFYDYFDVVEDQLRSKLNQVEQEKQEKVEETREKVNEKVEEQKEEGQQEEQKEQIEENEKKD